VEIPVANFEDKRCALDEMLLTETETSIINAMKCPLMGMNNELRAQSFECVSWKLNREKT
jgi:hypothetical protein